MAARLTDLPSRLARCRGAAARLPAPDGRRRHRGGAAVAAALAQVIAPYPFDQMHIPDRFSPPSLHYLAGTDEYGRDVFSRVLIGSQLSLLLGVIATLISMGIGVPLGMLAGYRRGADSTK